MNPVVKSDVLSICIFPLLVLHFNCYSRPLFGIILRSCFMLVLPPMLDSSYITRYVAFQTLKATTAQARLNSSLARLICVLLCLLL